MNSFLKGSCIATTLCAFLVGCGGGGGSSSSNTTNPTQSKAYLIDAAVSGVKYVNSDGSTGFTGSDGSFDYKSGTTSFFVGGIKIGEISSKTNDDKIFIQDLVGVERKNVNHPKVLKIATLLQSIDTDPSTIEIEVGDNFKKFENETKNIDSLDLNSALTSRSFTVKSENEVKNHLEKVLTDNNVALDKVAPTITSTSLDSTVKVSDNITVNFSESILVESVTSSNIVLKKADNSTVATSISYNSSNNSVIINPNANLDSNTQYTLTISNIQDSASNSLANTFTKSFTTDLAPDGTVPTVTFNGETSNVALHQPLKVTFSEAMNENTINNTNISLKDVGNNSVDINVSYSSSDFVTTITPTTLLKVNTEYTLKLSDKITDLAGNKIETDSDGEKRVKFTTLSVADSTAPTISSTSVENGATISDGSNITITFSKEVNQKTLAGNIFLKKDDVDFNTSTNITYNGNVATIDPISLLSKGANYTLTVKNGITDIYGNKLDYSSDKTYNFSVEAEADTSRPELIDGESSITNNQKDVEINSNFSFTFNENLTADTVTNGGVSLKDLDGNSVDLNVTYNNKVVTINPNADLAYSTKYNLTLHNTIKDLAGNAFNGHKFLSGGPHNKVFTFITKADSNDTTAPTITSATNLGNKNVDEVLTVTFSEMLNENDITSKVKVNNSGYSVKYSNKVFTITPNTTKISENYISTTVKYDTDYKITFDKDIADLAGNKLGSDLEVTFHTNPEKDTTAPKISLTNPINNNININVDSNLVITFNENIKNENLTASNITLTTEDDTNTNLLSDSDITLNANILTINPSNNLEYDKKYIVTLKKDAIKDLGDNALNTLSDYTFNFTTRESAKTVVCENGYLEYNNKCYKTYTDTKSWDDAKQNCTDNNSTLFSKVLFERDGYGGELSTTKINSFASALGLDTTKAYWTLNEGTNSNYASALQYEKPIIGDTGSWGRLGSSYELAKTEKNLYICEKN